jgi:Zn ribbon nucleic-acid-binding protein
MRELQKKAEKAWDALIDLEEYGYCNQEDCENCPQSGGDEDHCMDRNELQNWLRDHGFPASRPHIYTVTELSQQVIRGRKINNLAAWIMNNVEAAKCPGCGETLYRERRVFCLCGSVYPADKWANGEPCDCGCMDARYFGIHSANRLGQLEFQRCQTPGCRWGGDYRRLTVQELADAAQAEADRQWAAARTCPACGGASGIAISKDGVFPAIKSCEYCGWQNHKSEGEEK